MPDLIAPLYQDAGRPQWSTEPPLLDGATAHLGLWYTRFFDRYERAFLDGATDTDALGKEAKTEWVQTVAGRHGDVERLAERARRTRRLIEGLGGACSVLETRWHFVTGLGAPHPVENGFTWHPTLGLPYLPASSIKGLLRAWVEVWQSEARPKEAATRRVEQWFGTTEQAGDWIVFDALPVAPVTLAADVMTPHRGAWYAEGGTIDDVEGRPERVPADWHSPTPVPFLVVEQAKFLVGVAPRTRLTVLREDSSLDDVLLSLHDAFARLGAGAKTAVGYGRMEPAEAEGS